MPRAAQVGEIRESGGVRRQKVGPGKWKRLKSGKKGGKKESEPKSKRGTIIKDKDGSEYMNVGPNQFAPVTKTGDKYVFDNTRQGVQLHTKHGQVQRKPFKAHVGHVVSAQNIKKRGSASSIKPEEIKEQKHQIEDRARVHSRTTQMGPGHIVKVLPPKKRFNIGAFEKQGMVGKIKQIKDKVAQVVDQLGAVHHIPIHALDFAKAKEVHKLQGTMILQGLGINIENRKGSIRRGQDRKGNVWSTEMKVPYGEIRKTKGADGDPVDVFIGPNPKSKKVFVIHINNPMNGRYDEDKVMIGFNRMENAYDMFSLHYDKAGDFFHSMDEMTMAQFKKKVFSGKYRGKMLKSALALRRSLL